MDTVGISLALAKHVHGFFKRNFVYICNQNDGSFGRVELAKCITSRRSDYSFVLPYVTGVMTAVVQERSQLKRSLFILLQILCKVSGLGFSGVICHTFNRYEKVNHVPQFSKPDIKYVQLRAKHENVIHERFVTLTMLPIMTCTHTHARKMLNSLYVGKIIVFSPQRARDIPMSLIGVCLVRNATNSWKQTTTSKTIFLRKFMFALLPCV